jgi:hypothetical protein
MTNPGADVSYKFYFGVPLLSGISVSAGSSSFSAYDLFADNWILIQNCVMCYTALRDRIIWLSMSK